jgi:predicted O-linked N-acetylglucosamine transferase (SPINDLY family)
LYRLALGADPRQFEALHFLGLIEAQRGRYEEARTLMSRSLEINRRVADAHSNYARVLNALNRSEEAVAACDRALKIDPRSLAALVSRGIALHRLGRYEHALQNYERALALKPGHSAALINRAQTLLELSQPEEAIAEFEKVLAGNPSDPDALAGRGRALGLLNRYEEALASCERALTINPNHVSAHLYRAIALRSLRRFEETLSACDRVLALAPGNAEALCHRGGALVALDRRPEAMANFEAALAVDPSHRLAFGGCLGGAIVACDWRRLDQLLEQLPARLNDERSVIDPFIFLGYSTDPSEQLRCARKTYKLANIVPAQRKWSRSGHRRGRLRVAYFSADFRRHATAYLMAELFEIHDRQRFEIIAVSYHPGDSSTTRERLIKSFDRFLDVSTWTDQKAADLARDLDVDIAVDLNGLTTNTRIGILAHRVAPVQVSYLGYPGTTGADFIDYVVADRTVLPFDQEPWYTEKIVHLPDCYQVNDRRRRISERTPTRREAGLPDQGFVFCSFNNLYKVARPVFEIWMRLLERVEGSVLWLLQSNDLAAENLRREAYTRGVDPNRIVFARPLELADHLARHALADLFLDTLPYNAHTTASDSLWAGLPVLTCRGTMFAGRVAASLLQAVGLPELITENLSGYEALAAHLAADPSRLRELRQKLMRNRLACPLFDTDRLRRHLEAAYLRMWEICERGEAPRSFAIEPIGG